VAIVTGAGAPGGIGAAVAREIVAEGRPGWCWAPPPSACIRRAAELGDAAVGVIADLTVDGGGRQSGARRAGPVGPRRRAWQTTQA